MAINIYKGKLNLVGAGKTYSNGSNMTSVIEIGDHQVKQVFYSDYLKNYLIAGKQMELQIQTGNPLLRTLGYAMMLTIILLIPGSRLLKESKANILRKVIVDGAEHSDI